MTPTPGIIHTITLVINELAELWNIWNHFTGRIPLTKTGWKYLKNLPKNIQNYIKMKGIQEELS
jgi:hypothetical protein